MVSNFPFGKNASLAVKFVNHAAQFAEVVAILASIDWSGVKSRTAGNPSIGKAELVAAYQARIAQSGLASTNGPGSG